MVAEKRYDLDPTLLFTHSPYVDRIRVIQNADFSSSQRAKFFPWLGRGKDTFPVGDEIKIC
ncbi:MAG: hypothetical protein ONB31_07355 [candidate division KSB1 bacterium]|nr:hypothetical protein [candidate division KSB1 bacterium]MDZ7335639.1 hypothetical protein [candidate division KSB1 bacterium]MDZ7358083.1 hypothetical protein [candidate division KSB1 bacterium]MDZ7399837.1 hypothetical protein [candidate division KSB1 bacterium]